MQDMVKAEAQRFNVLCCGARWGKNILLRDLMVPPMLEGFPVAWYAPHYKMLEEDWRAVKVQLRPVTVDKDENEHRIVILGGGSVDMWSLDQPDTSRGRPYKLALINEAAMVPGLEYAWNMVIRPRLTDYEGGGWFASTPNGRTYFWHLWQQGQDRDAWPDWMSWNFPSAANPYLSPQEIEKARLEMPEKAFRQEYLAEFLEGEGTVFRNIIACTNAPTTLPGDHAGHSIVMGADWGKQDDFTALSVLCLTCHSELAHDRFNKIDYAFQRSRLVSLATHWGVETICAESNSMGVPIIEQLGRDPELDHCRIVPFNTLPSTKPQLIEHLSLAFERAECQWLADPVWTAELEAYEMKASKITGRAVYSAPLGMHDDTVIARALAWSRSGKWLIA